VYPGATHTRFEHALGAYHLARVTMGLLRERGDLAGVSDEECAITAVAALLHDVGHYPFSHAVEELEVDQIRRHTDIARDLITGELAAILEERWDADPSVVASLVAGPQQGDPPLTETQLLLRSLLDSSLDVDKLDYLVRDARGANVPYGVVDTQRLIGTLAVRRDEDGRAGLAVETKGVSALQSLVFAKHLMFATVYWHHACRAGVVMLLRALQEALRAGYVEAASVERCDDAELMAALGSSDAPDVVAALARGLRDRRLYKRAVEIGVDDERFDRLERLWFRPAQRAVLEDGWAASCGAHEAGVLLDVPEPRPIVVDLPVIVDGGEASEWDHVSGLSTTDLDRFQQWVRKIRVFAAGADVAAALSSSQVV
jgi:HD superfamily phosphohydrolase